MRTENTVNGLFNAVENLTTSARLHKPTGSTCLELHLEETRSERACRRLEVSLGSSARMCWDLHRSPRVKMMKYWLQKHVDLQRKGGFWGLWSATTLKAGRGGVGGFEKDENGEIEVVPYYFTVNELLSAVESSYWLFCWLFRKLTAIGRDLLHYSYCIYIIFYETYYNSINISNT